MKTKVSIPFSWFKCVNCHASLSDAQGTEEHNGIICPQCGTTNKIAYGGGGGNINFTK